MRPIRLTHRAVVWGVFVEPDHRGEGWGEALLFAAIDLAHSWPGLSFLDLSVSENAPEARALYLRVGFGA
jgi:ribosomal protein S18 acetylase RimI-like enzyme